MGKKTRSERGSERRFIDELINGVVILIKRESNPISVGSSDITEIHIKKTDGNISIITAAEDFMFIDVG